MDYEQKYKIENEVEEMFDRNDAKVFEIMHRIAEIACGAVIQSNDIIEQ